MFNYGSPFLKVGGLASLGAKSGLKKGLFSKVGGSSLSTFLTNTQKTIGTVNQIIPLYNQVKPMFENTKIIKNVLSGLKDSSSKGLFRNKRRNNNYAYKEEKTPEIKKEIVEETKPQNPFFNI